MDCIFPSKLTAGLTVTKLVTLADHAAPDWVLSVALRGPGSIDLTAAAEGAQHRLQAAADATAAWLPGLYRFSARVTGAAGVFEVESGTSEVLPDLFAQAAGYDGRSHARKTLAAIEAVLEKRATLDQERYRINNRELYRTPIAELLKLRDVYRSEVRREDAAARGKSLFGPAVRVRF